MTPVFLKPPSSPLANLVEQKDQDQQVKALINSQYNYEASSSLSSPANYFFNSSSTQDQTSDAIGSQQRDDHKAVIDVFSSTSTSQNLSTCQRDQDNIGDQDQHNLSNNNKNMNNGSAKYWMSSKMRLMQKMSNPESSATIPNRKLDGKVGLHSSPRQEYNFSGEAMFKFSPGSNSTTTDTAVRVCSDCNTTTTPLWRSGPRGPKSLCNACGIRQRKARRAMAEAAAAAASSGLAAAPESGTTAANYTPYIKSTTASNNYYKTQYHVNKEKKSRGNHNISHYKNKLKLVKSERNDNNISNNKLCLGKFSFGLNNDKCCSAFPGVFPKDVAEAAVLLMELSCGFLQS